MNKRLSMGALLALALLAGSGQAMAEEQFWEWMFNFQRTKEVKPVTLKSYQEECSACHYAYPPGLLPAKSWEKLLTETALHDHFGDNAELDAATLQAIRAYVLENAADKSWYKRSRKIALATAEGEPPLRITLVSYIKRKHQDIPEKMVKGNKDVKSLSYCDKCHTQAEQGVFDDDTVKIPGYDSWDE